MGDFFIAYKKWLLYIDIRSCICTIYYNRRNRVLCLLHRNAIYIEETDRVCLEYTFIIYRRKVKKICGLQMDGKITRY